MSFNGDLEHIPLVDVIQLLHMTGKSGVLHLQNPKGESQLVFRDGFFVSANHLNNSVRIGKVLVDMEAISVETLNQALTEQRNAGKNRKPLIATLIEQGLIDKVTAFKGLEKLIEMTIVEVLTWTSGSFSLDVSDMNISDEYRYFPEKLQQEFLLNAQSILLESLRIYDEKLRDGSLYDLFFTDQAGVPSPSSGLASADITAELLGLASLDEISHKIPEVFIGLKDHDPVAEHRRAVTRALPEMTIDQQEQLVNFLVTISTPAATGLALPVTAVVLLTQNELFSHALSTLCKQINLFMFSSDEEAGLDTVIEQSLSRDLHPVLIIDIPHGDAGTASLALVRQKTAAYPSISIVFAACNHFWRTNGMAALVAGGQSLIPRPCGNCHKTSYVSDIIKFIPLAGEYLKAITPQPPTDLNPDFIAALSQLKSRTTPPEITLVLLRFAALQFERALTLVVANTELIAEKSIGITSEKIDGPSPPLMFKLPLDKQSVFQDVIKKHMQYFGQRSDLVLTDLLYKQIGAPRSPKVMVLPLINRDKVIAVIYADFGAKPVYPPQINLMAALAHCAGSILDNPLYLINL